MFGGCAVVAEIGSPEFWSGAHFFCFFLCRFSRKAQIVKESLFCRFKKVAAGRRTAGQAARGRRRRKLAVRIHTKPARA